jgi:putative transposase
MKRKRYSGELKARVAVEALRGIKTANEIARFYKLHPNLVGLWKRQALESLPEIFSGRRDRHVQDEEELRKELYARIGELEMEREWLKKNGGALPSRRSEG